MLAARSARRVLAKRKEDLLEQRKRFDSKFWYDIRKKIDAEITEIDHVTHQINGALGEQ